MSKNYRSITFIFSVSIFLQACGSTPKKSLSTNEDPFLNIHSVSSQKIDRLLTNQFLVIEEHKVLQYLNRVSEQVFKKRNKDSKAPRVFLTSSERGTLGVRTWVLPPDKIYLDIKTLKLVKFENEIAALLSFYYERTSVKSFKEKWAAIEDSYTPNLETLFSWNETEDFQSIEASIDSLYYANYDPRSLVSVFSKLEAAQYKNDFSTPFDLLKSKTTRALSFYPPLINPIVQTDDFYRVKKIWERL